MKQKWAYVVCELIDDMPSFRHAIVEAESAEDAYDVGHATVRQPDGNGLNDYAFPLSGHACCDGNDPACPEHGVAASTARQNNHSRRNPRGR